MTDVLDTNDMEDVSQFDKLFDAFKDHLGSTKDVNSKRAMQGYLLPLLDAFRSEVSEILGDMQDRIEDLEEDSINGKAEKLVTDARNVIEQMYNCLNYLMIKHEYIANNNYTENADETLKSLHLASQSSMITWFTEYKSYESATEDDIEDGDAETVETPETQEAA